MNNKKCPFFNCSTDKYDNEKCTFWEFDELNEIIQNNEHSLYSGETKLKTIDKWADLKNKFTN